MEGVPNMRGIVGVIVGLSILVLSSAPAEANLKIFACYPEWQALAQELGGDAVEVFVAAGQHADPAHIDVTPALIAALKQADLLICTGAASEGKWMPDALKRANNAKLGQGQPGLFFALDFVEALKSSNHSHDAEDENAPHEHGNPHIQGDPYRVRALAGQLARRMIELDKPEAKRFGDNAKTFIRDLGKLIKTLEVEAAPLRGVNIAAQHGNMVYLLNWLQINSVAIIEHHAGVKPAEADLSHIVEQVPRDNIKFIVYAAHEDPQSSAYVAEHAGIALAKVPFTVNGTSDAKTFGDFYRSSVQRMLDALAGNDRS
jgi:zinc/manganese transport system substrate-binding protein